jgi:hypothetical protein
VASIILIAAVILAFVPALICGVATDLITAIADEACAAGLCCGADGGPTFIVRESAAVGGDLPFRIYPAREALVS